MYCKYSPTVRYWYRKNQNWFEENGGYFGNGQDPDSDFDDDGYDSYGYSDHEINGFGEGPDRAGYTENQYMGDEELYEQVYQEWFQGDPSIRKD